MEKPQHGINSKLEMRKDLTCLKLKKIACILAKFVRQVQFVINYDLMKYPLPSFYQFEYFFYSKRQL